MKQTSPRARRGRHAGFTLIELLVVVAIISILSAIAVPNFLEAQTRAKITRVKADMRALSLAIESYHVDRNKYPFRCNTNPGQPTLPEVKYRLKQMSVITTPVSYISSFPIDIFEKTLLPPNNVIDYWDPDQAANYVNTSNFGSSRKQYHVSSGDIGYMLVSVGPDGYIGQSTTDNYGWPWRPKPIQTSMNNAYDPTNGTVSLGNLYWCSGAGLDKTPSYITDHMPQKW